MELRHLIAFGGIVAFVGYLLLSKYPRRAYLLGLLVLLPFIDLKLTTDDYGGISIFDAASFLIFLIHFEKIRFSKGNDINLILFILLCILVFIGSVKSEFVLHSLMGLLKLLSIFIYAKMLVDECVDDRSFSDLVIKYLKAGCLFSIVFLILQVRLGLMFTFYENLNPNVFSSDSTRYPSYFHDPQKYAQYLSMVSLLFLFNKLPNNKTIVFNMVFFMAAVTGIFLTGSRAPFLGLCIGLALICFLRKDSLKIVILAVLVGFIVVSSYSSYFSLFNRQEDIGTSYEVRNSIWNDNLLLFLENPLLGIGIDNHHNYVVKHSLVGYLLLDNEVVYHGTENGYFKILIELGFFGFILVSILVLRPIVLAFISVRKNNDVGVIFILASITSWLVANITVDSLSDKRILVVVVTLISLLIASITRKRSAHA